MEALKSSFGTSRCSLIFFGLLLLFASAMSSSQAKIHQHQFVVRSLSLSLLFLPLLIMIKYRLFGMTDSSNTSEEAAQNPQHHHGEWAISGSNLGRQQWRHFDC
jgi:hypothetical protein